MPRISEKSYRRHAQLFPLNVPLDKFSVNIYTLNDRTSSMGAAPGYPSRLSDLDKMKDMLNILLKRSFSFIISVSGDFQDSVKLPEFPYHGGI